MFDESGTDAGFNFGDAITNARNVFKDGKPQDQEQLLKLNLKWGRTLRTLMRLQNFIRTMVLALHHKLDRIVPH